jgi:hypothetical protein
MDFIAVVDGCQFLDNAIKEGFPRTFPQEKLDEHDGILFFDKCHPQCPYNDSIEFDAKGSGKCRHGGRFYLSVDDNPLINGSSIL